VRADLTELLTNEILARAPWVTEASLFGSFVRDEMQPNSDLDLALISPSGKAAKLGVIIEDLSDATVRRFGNPIDAVIGRGSIQISRVRRIFSKRSARRARWRLTPDNFVSSSPTRTPSNTNHAAPPPRRRPTR